MNIKGVICFGDSVIFGTGASNRNLGCGRILRSILDVPVLVKGKNNHTTREGLKRLEKEVLSIGGYSHVIILFGNNDCRLIDIDTPCVDIPEYKNNIITMVEKIKKNKKIPLLSNLQPITDEGSRSIPEMKNYIRNIKSPYEWHRRYSDTLNDIASSTGVNLIDIHSVLKNYSNKVISEDDLHPNDLGHKIIAEEFRRSLCLC